MLNFLLFMMCFSGHDVINHKTHAQKELDKVEYKLMYIQNDVLEYCTPEVYEKFVHLYTTLDEIKELLDKDLRD